MCTKRRVFPEVLKLSQIHFIMNLKSFSKFPKNYPHLLAEAKYFLEGGCKQRVTFSVTNECSLLL